MNLGNEPEILDLTSVFNNLPDQLIVYESSIYSQLYGLVPYIKFNQQSANIRIIKIKY